MIPILARYIAEKHVDSSLAQKLESLRLEDELVIAKFIEILDPSANTLREILRLVEEVSLRDEVPISEVLSLCDPILAERIGRKDKQRLVREELSRMRYPLLKKLEHDLSSCQREIVMKYGVRIEYPKELEGDAVELKLEFRTTEELHNAAEGLKELSQDPLLSQLFSLLKGGELEEKAEI